MTVQLQTSTQYYAGPITVGTVLSIKDFTFIDNSHVSAKIRNDATKWVYGVDYTVAGAGETTRTITVKKEVKDGEVLAVYLDIPITQMVHPEEGGSFPAAINEFTLDKLTYICQMLQERINRSIQISIDTPFNGVLSKLIPNRTFKINADATGIELSEYDPDTALNATKQYRDEAEGFSQEAEASAQAAKASETNAKTSEINAKTSETNAKASEVAAEQYKNATQTIADKALQDIGTAENSAISNIQTKGGKYVQEARDWAIKMDGKVNDEDYSAKYYAEEAKILTAGSLNQKQITNCILSAPNGVITYSGTTVTIKQGLKVLLTNGNNADETINNIEYTYTEDYSRTLTLTGQTGTYIIFANTGGFAFININNYFEGPLSERPTAQAGYTYYATDTRAFYQVSDNEWSQVASAEIARILVNNGIITSIIAYQPVELCTTNTNQVITGIKTFNDSRNIYGDENKIIFKNAGYAGITLQSTLIDKSIVQEGNTFYHGVEFRDKNNQRLAWIGIRKENSATLSDIELQNQNNGGFKFPRCTTKPTTTSTASDSRVAVVVQNYLNGSSGYRVWSDKYCEQWGEYTVPVLGVSQTTAIKVTFMKKFVDLNYNVFTNPVIDNGNSFSLRNYAVDKTTAYCNIAMLSNKEALQSTGKWVWKACGYIA